VQIEICTEVAPFKLHNKLFPGTS